MIEEVGFTVEKMIEPLPTDELLEQYPDYKDLFHKPNFLLLRVKNEWEIRRRKKP